MIHFFRKIRQQLLSENKFKKYWIYAIGEILLVVIGILIALQINNWNQEKQERIREKEVLQDILTNLERNNNLIRESLLLLNDFDESTEIVLSILRNNSPFSDTLGKHFFSSTRTGGLLFPLSSEGYESLKNAGFDIIRSEFLKDRILGIFEISYERIRTKAHWTMYSSTYEEEYINSLFRQETGERLIPINFNKLANDSRFYTILMNVKESKRGFLKEDVINCLDESKEVVRLLKAELKR